MPGILTILLTAVALSMDAFAVAVGKGLATRRLTLKCALTVGVWFGVFQAVMPLIGYYLGKVFSDRIEAVDHWVSFGLLLLIGLNMIREALSHREEPASASLAPTVMLLLALATSVDALAAGVAFAFSGAVNIWFAVSLIGIVTFLFSAAGTRIGNLFGAKYQAKAELVGGVILVLLGVKILFQGLGVLELPI